MRRLALVIALLPLTGACSDAAPAPASKPAPATSGPTAGIDQDALVIAHSKPSVSYTVSEPQTTDADVVDALTAQAQDLADRAQAQLQSGGSSLGGLMGGGSDQDALAGAMAGLVENDLSDDEITSAAQAEGFSVITAEDGSTIVEGITVPTKAQAKAAAKAEINDANADAQLAALLAEIEAQLAADEHDG